MAPEAIGVAGVALGRGDIASNLARLSQALQFPRASSIASP